MASTGSSPRNGTKLSLSSSLSSDLLLQANKELHEKPEWRNRDIEALRIMVNRVPALNADVSDASLLRFLRVCKFEYDMAFEHVLDYYDIRRRHPELFAQFSPMNQRATLSSRIFSVLDECDYRGARVVIVDMKKWYPDIYTTDELSTTFLLICELLSTIEAVQVTGVTVILDVRGLSLSLALRRQPMRKLVQVTKSAVLLRIKAIHIVHDSYSWNPLVAVIKPLLLTDKIRQRVHFHGNNANSLYEYMDPDVAARILHGENSALGRVPLTASYDGLLDNVESSLTDHPSPTSTNNTLQWMLNGQAYFEQSNQYGFISSISPTSQELAAYTEHANRVDQNQPVGCRLLFTSYKKLCIDSFN